jgi:Baseplate J-like protein
MVAQYPSKNDQRRRKLRNHTDADGRFLLNGIDYLEVSADRQTLAVHFLHPLPGQVQAVPDGPELTAFNVVITGGTRLRQVEVRSVSAFARCLTVQIYTPGDFSTYTLRLIRSAADPTPPSGFDPQLAQVDFSFRVEELSEFDCQPAAAPPAPTLPPPVIDYLAKDYASFRQLMLDRLSVIMPQWRERNPADLGMVLVELLAYSADQLSYYQDAVATEAYLSTARQRISVRRHARLLDYLMHDGCNARAWVTLDASRDPDPKAKPFKLPPGTLLLTQVEGMDAVVPSREVLVTLFNAGAQAFETMHELMLYKSRNELAIYTWGNPVCELPAGTTQATLLDANRTFTTLNYLMPGDVLIFEEIKGQRFGRSAEANPAHRHAVRLTQVTANYDPLFDQALIDVAWSVEDALPFPLTVSILVDDRVIDEISIVHGNVVLVDQGRTVIAEALPTPTPDRYRPSLKYQPLTQQGMVVAANQQWVTVDRQAAASAAMQWQMRDVRPQIRLQETEPEQTWLPQYDLLNSGRFDRTFVAETGSDGRTYLRFGDNVLGKRPEANLTATYRFGNGTAGNVGAEAIAHIWWPEATVALTKIRNPLPAQGGVDPEPIEQVRLYAPHAFRVPQRAVTETDYAAVAERYPTVRKAVATRRWTGSWQTVFITVDRTGGQPVDRAFRQQLRDFLERFRMAGHDLEINDPQFVALDLAMTVQVMPNYYRSAVKAALLTTFGRDRLPDGRPGFFSPEQFTFGQPVYLSQVIAQAMAVAGVQAVKVTRFHRWGEPPVNELATGQITFGALEIARLENDPNAPEQGRLTVNLEGGL